VSTINGDIRTDPNQGGRRAGSLKDGTFIRALVVMPGNAIDVRTVEGATLYRETGIPQDYSIQSVSAERSTFSGKLVLIMGGFTPNTSDSRTLIITTDYSIATPVY